MATNRDQAVALLAMINGDPKELAENRLTMVLDSVAADAARAERWRIAQLVKDRSKQATDQVRRSYLLELGFDIALGETV